jgi:protein-export membrane protein SecD
VLHFARWKIITISASILVAALLCLPNFLPKAQQEALSGYGLRPMTLGLDLQGGSNVLLEVDRADMKEQLQTQAASDIRAALREAKIAYSNIARTADGVTVKISKPEDLAKAKERLNLLLQPQQGNILSGAATVNVFALETLADGYALKITDAGMAAKIAAAIQQSLRIVEKRVNALGTTEPVIQQQGVDRIAVQLPGIDNPDKVKNVIGTTAKLTFQLVCEEQPTGVNQTPPQDCRAYPPKEAVDAALVAKKEKGSTVGLTDAELKALPQTWVQTSSRATVDGQDLTDAQPGFDQSNRPVVTFRFNAKGAQRFGNLTRDNVNKPFAILLDDIIQSAPVINEPILGGSGQISGNFTTEETGNLSIVLKSGALPAKLNIVEERTVGPSLGADSVRAGFVACAIGLVGVMAFMFLPYGFFGLIANLALLANLLLLVACMSFFGFTLTLPGIAGILLTLGMAVDSNVLIYERIREEWRNGRTALSSIEVGFKSALGTVLDANLTTLIAAVVLFGVGSGPVRGFAVTLAIGIFTTMFTAFTVTRMLVAVWVKNRRPKEINL